MSAHHYLWRVRCKTAANCPEAFIERDPQGLPCWAQEQTEMLPLPDAERLKADAAHALGGTLYLEPVEKTFRNRMPY